MGVVKKVKLVSRSCQQRDISVLLPELKVDVREPVLIFRLPFHPPLEDSSAPAHVTQRLLHVGVLQPKLKKLTCFGT